MKAKRILSALLCALLLTSCGGETVVETESADTAAVVVTEPVETEPDRISDDLPAMDFGGEEFNILTTTWYTALRYIYAEELTGDVMNDALYNSRAETEERFNVKVNATAEQDITPLATTIHSMVLAGDEGYQLTYSHDLLTVGNAMKGDFLDIRSLPNINFDKPWWNGTSETFTVGGKLLFTGNCLSLAGIFMNYMLVVNKDLALDYGVEIPYDKVQDGTWYLDDLIALVEDFPVDTDGNGTMDDKDTYGFITSYYGHMGMQSDLEGCLLEKDADGYLTFVDNTNRIVGILEKAEKLFLHGTDAYGAGNAFGVDLFANHQAVFMFGEGRVLYDNVRQTDVVYGILPFPKYDETQNEYRSSGCDIYWAVPKTVVGQGEKIGAVVESICCTNYNDVVPSVWEMVLGRKLSDSEEDSAMFNIIRDIQYVDTGYAFSGQVPTLTNLIFMTENVQSGAAVSFIKSKKEATITKIEAINQFYRDYE